MNLEHQVGIAKQARAIMASYPEVESIVTQSGRPDDGTDTEGYLQRRVLRAVAAAARLAQGRAGRPAGGGGSGDRRRRERSEKLVAAMNADLERDIPGVTGTSRRTSVTT